MPPYEFINNTISSSCKQINPVIQLENIENQIGALVYEQPILKKYGSMKEFTMDASGSASDGMASSGNDRNSPNDDRSGSALADDLIEDDNFFATDVVVDDTSRNWLYGTRYGRYWRCHCDAKGYK